MFYIFFINLTDMKEKYAFQTYHVYATHLPFYHIDQCLISHKPLFLCLPNFITHNGVLGYGALGYYQNCNKVAICTQIYPVLPVRLKNIMC